MLSASIRLSPLSETDDRAMGGNGCKQDDPAGGHHEARGLPNSRCRTSSINYPWQSEWKIAIDVADFLEGRLSLRLVLVTKAELFLAEWLRMIDQAVVQGVEGCF